PSGAGMYGVGWTPALARSTTWSACCVTVTPPVLAVPPVSLPARTRCNVRALVPSSDFASIPEAGASGVLSATPAPEPPAKTATSASAAGQAATNAKRFLLHTLLSPLLLESARFTPEPRSYHFLA